MMKNKKYINRRDFLKKSWSIPIFILLGPLNKELNAGSSDLGGGHGQGGGWGAGGNPKNN